MSAGTVEVLGFDLPEYLSWDELEELPEEIANDIELWERKVFWTSHPPLEHQRFSIRMQNALEASSRRAVQRPADDEEKPGWEVGKADVFFAADKSSVLTPDFLIRRCLPPGSDTTAADVVVVGEVLWRTDTLKRRLWKMDRYAEADIPWYWEVEVEPGDCRAISAVRAYELVLVPTAGLPVKLLRPAMYGLAGEWEPRDVAIDFPEPFGTYIAWEDLAF